MTKEHFQSIRPLLENANKRTNPHTVGLFELWCAVFYLLRTGCRWRVLPSDVPK
ncbi:transposase [Oceanisphaera sp. KMM 10153]|uniref:transposase n=1 Tax=Oceanisphaera submarina TaxID=3390193 RepID=UPI00397700D5